MAKTINPALSKPLQPQPKLAAVVGNAPLARSEAIKKVWDYIKKNGLQDKVDKRSINADATLLALFDGKKQITMFQLAKYISANLK